MEAPRRPYVEDSGLGRSPFLAPWSFWGVGHSCRGGMGDVAGVADSELRPCLFSSSDTQTPVATKFGTGLIWPPRPSPSTVGTVLSWPLWMAHQIFSSVALCHDSFMFCLNLGQVFLWARRQSCELEFTEVHVSTPFLITSIRTAEGNARSQDANIPGEAGACLIGYIEGGTSHARSPQRATVVSIRMT